MNKVCESILDSIARTTPEQIPTDTKAKVREYVDVNLAKHLDDLTVSLILKLKDLYFRRKLKQPKTKKQNRPAKKRYITGLSEVRKHLLAGNLTMVMLAINMEKVEET